jgi:hypothetical protein
LGEKEAEEKNPAKTCNCFLLLVDGVMFPKKFEKNLFLKATTHTVIN